MRNTVAANGGGSEVEVVGTVLSGTGLPAANTLVKYVPENYNVVTMGPIPDSMIDTTDAQGVYRFSNVRPGLYNIQAVNLSTRTRLLISKLDVHGDTTRIPDATLQGTGAIKIMLPDSANAINGYIYVPGTELVTFINGVHGFVLLDSVSCGTIPEVKYAVTNTSSFKVMSFNVAVTAGDTALVVNPSWTYVKQLNLNTSVYGANITENVYGFPVVIRLNSGNFDFSKANADGSDIRFVKSDNTPLPFEIERFDSMHQQAEIWVKIDTVFGNNSTQAILLYCGTSTSSVTPGSNSAAVFDTANGFAGVWHLGETAGTTVFDATGNHYNGTVSDTAPIAANGAIGSCKQFNGVSNYIHVADGAQSKLDFSQTSPHTISAWVNLDTLDSVTHFIAGKSDQQYFLKVYPWTTGDLHWEFTEYYSNEGWHILYFPAVSKTWKFIEGRFDGNVQQLFVDGVLVSDSILYSADSLLRNNAQDFMIGRFNTYSTTKIEKYGYFIGKIDEVCVSNVARSNAWTKLCYMNQRADDKLIIYK
jgi:hypothetical protein